MYLHFRDYFYPRQKMWKSKKHFPYIGNWRILIITTSINKIFIMHIKYLSLYYWNKHELFQALCCSPNTQQSEVTTIVLWLAITDIVSFCRNRFDWTISSGTGEDAHKKVLNGRFRGINSFVSHEVLHSFILWLNTDVYMQNSHNFQTSSNSTQIKSTYFCTYFSHLVAIKYRAFWYQNLEKLGVFSIFILFLIEHCQ